MRTPDAGFWRGRRVGLTGHTGFKGAWATLLLHRLGAEVSGFSLPQPVSEPALFEAARLGELCGDTRGDIRDGAALQAWLADARPEVLIHMAAQPIVRTSVRDPLDTFDVNVMGTARVLEAARRSSELRAIVIVTSDKCYENRERLSPYREDEAMGGSDPYSASKGCAELVTAAFARTYFRGAEAKIASVRAGNVIGGGDWAADRLIPDLVRAALSGEAVDVRSPSAVRPWQHVLDPVAGYLLAAEAVVAGRSTAPQDAWNFGPNPGEELNVRQVVEAFQGAWGDGLYVRFAAAEDDAAVRKQEAGLLRVDNTKAKIELGWRPALTNEAAVDAAASWYRDFRAGGDARRLSEHQIEAFLGL